MIRREMSWLIGLHVELCNKAKSRNDAISALYIMTTGCAVFAVAIKWTGSLCVLTKLEMPFSIFRQLRETAILRMLQKASVLLKSLRNILLMILVLRSHLILYPAHWLAVKSRDYQGKINEMNTRSKRNPTFNYNITLGTIQWLRLALSKGPNWVGVFSPTFTWGRKQIKFPKRRVFLL
jgi:hypothetical protein